jgi:hypothetical protein
MKDWYRSKGIVGSLLGLVAGVLGLSGVDIDQAHVERATDLITGDCGQSVVSLFTIAGSALSLWGRHTATDAIRWRKSRD